MKKLIAFIVLITSKLLVFCQNGYPKIINNGIDSCICISFEQAKIINKTKIERDMYKTISDSLEFLKNKIYEKVRLGEMLVNELNQKISLKDSLIFKEQKISLYLQSENEKLNKKIKRNKTIHTAIYSIVGVFVTGLITYIALQ